MGVSFAYGVSAVSQVPPITSGEWALAYPYVGGKTALSLKNTRQALAEAQARTLNQNGRGAARSTFLCLGDSTVFGFQSGNNGLYVRRNAWAAYLARNLTELGYGGNSAGIFGDGASGSLQGGDDRLTAGAGWSAATTIFAQNGWVQSAAGGALTWTPDSAIDTVDVYYLTFAGQGTFTVDNGGAAFITQNTGAVPTATMAKVSATITSSANPINIKWSAGGGSVLIIGFRAYVGNNTGIDVINAGVSGSQSGDWLAAGAYSYQALVQYLAPACTFISLGFNDMQAAIPVATYQANLQTIATLAQNGGTGDVVFMIQHPQKITSHSLAIQQTYWNAANAAAIATGSAVINMPSRWVTGEAQAPLLFDDTHPNAAGHFDISRAIIDVILGV